MTEIGDLFLIQKFIGSRDAIRIAETSCGWIADVIGKPTVEISQVIIHLDGIESFFSDVDRAIDLALPFTDLNQIGKEYQLLQKSDSIYRIMSLVIACLSFFSHSAAALECLGLIGVIVLSSSVEGLGYTAGIVGVCVNLLALAKKTYDNALMLWCPQYYLAIKEVESSEEPNLSHDWTRNLCGITTDVCLVCFDLFRGLEFYYGRRGVPPAVYRFWRTTSSLTHTLENYIRYL